MRSPPDLPTPSPGKPGTGRKPAPKGALRPVIGWREWVYLPELLDLPINAKIDTGARTSAVHAFDVRTFTDNGEPWVEFQLHPVQRQRHPDTLCRARVLDQRHVTSSSGHKQLRTVIATTALIGGVHWPIELTLADRDQMGFRMLLGREGLRRRFVVDPAKSYRLSGRAVPAPLTPQEPQS